MTRFLLSLGMIATLPPLTGCGNSGMPAPTAGSLTRPSQVILHRGVELTQARAKALVYRVETVGMLEAEGQTDIAAGVAGVVDQVLFREGDEVLPGTLLVTIDQTRFQAEEQAARANSERAKTAMELARDLWERSERAKGSLSEEERIKARFNLGLAEAEYRTSQATHLLAQHRLNLSRVKAPYAGRVNKRLVTVGSYLEEKTTIATMADLSRIRLAGYVPESAAPILRRMLDTQDDRLQAARLGLLLAPSPSALTALPGPLLAHHDYVASGHDPEFTLLALPGQNFLARIFYMSTVANPDTHMFEAKAEVLGWKQDLGKFQVWEQKLAALPVAVSPPSTKQPAFDPFALPAPGADPVKPRKTFTDARMPGLTAKIRFPLRSSPESVVIPEEAVRASEHGFIVFVPEKISRKDGKDEWIARKRKLELGYRAEGFVEVLQNLRAGDWIVRRGAEALEDGTPIVFKK